MSLKTFFLYLFVCSIVLSALMGIWAIISGEFGDLQGRVLATTSTVVGASILGLACGAFLESPRSRGLPASAVPIFGIVLTLISALIMFWLIWASNSWASDGIIKALAATSLFALSFAQLSLLSMARLSSRFRWSIVLAYLVILSLASLISAIIVFELYGDGGFIGRLIGVLAVIDASMTVMIPIFHRLSRDEFGDITIPSINKIDAEIDGLKSRISHLERQREDILNAQADEREP